MIRVIVAEWHRVMHEASTLRDAVFIQEQRVPVELEWDEFDEWSWHAMAYDAQQHPCGTGRLLPA